MESLLIIDKSAVYTKYGSKEGIDAIARFNSLRRDVPSVIASMRILSIP